MNKLKAYYGAVKYGIFELKYKRHGRTQVICENDFSIIGEYSYTTGKVYEVDGVYNYIINGGMFPIHGSIKSESIITFMIYLDRLIENLKYQHSINNMTF